MQNLEKLLKAVDAQLGGVPEWKQLIEDARKELEAIQRRIWVNA